MPYTQLITKQHDSVMVLTLNRPEKLNAWTRQLNRELEDAIEAANSNDTVGAIVITGAGRAFCAGADIEESFKDPLDKGERAALNGGKNPGDSKWVELIRSSKPVIAAINGVAVGIGITMVLSADVIIASDQAKIGFFFVKMGVVPELGSTHFLTQRVGFSLASEMMLTGKLYEPSEYDGTGLVNRVVPAEDLLEDAMTTARLIAANPQPSLAAVKQLINANGTCEDLSAVVHREHVALAKSYETWEHKEAVQAFVEKRKPDFNQR